MKLSRRTLVLGVSAAAALPALAGCAGGGAPESADDPAPGGGGGAEDAFPVTITHKFGETTLTAAPTRVVCVGLTDQDFLLALGVVPVATTNWFGDAPGRIFSWAQDALGDGELPEVLDNTDGVPVETVAGLTPDLIIGQYAGITQQEYDLLSQIAPTVVQPGTYADYGVPWEEATITIGRAVGKQAEAEELVAQVQAGVEQYATDHPELQGRRGVVLTDYEGIFVYGPEDPRGRMLAALGLTFPEQLDADQPEEFGWSISPERTSDLDDLDLVVWLSAREDVDATTGGLWADTAVVADGRDIYVPPTGGDYYTAFSFVTPLSIPYVLERYVPQLLAAVDGDPATEVPEPS